MASYNNKELEFCVFLINSLPNAWGYLHQLYAKS